LETRRWNGTKSAFADCASAARRDPELAVVGWSVGVREGGLCAVV